MKEEFKQAEKFAKEYYQLDNTKEFNTRLKTVTVNSAIKFAERYHKKQCDMHVVMPMLLCKHSLWHQSLTEGKKYRLLFEGNGRYFIKDNKGNVIDYNKKCFEVIEAQ